MIDGWNFRALLRNEKAQRLLETMGAVNIDFLTQDNISYLLKIYDRHQCIPTSSTERAAIHELLNDKLQSKVEYRLINCSPFFMQFCNLSPAEKSHNKFFLKDTITDESKFSSLHLVAPLVNSAGSSFEFRFLAGSHTQMIPPRSIYEQEDYWYDTNFVQQNFSSLKIKAGGAVIFFRDIPHSFSTIESSVPLLEISILPYEAKQIIYIHAEHERETSRIIQPYRITIADYIRYVSGEKSAFTQMRPLREIEFDYSPISPADEKKLTLKFSWRKLILKYAGLRD